MEERNEDALSEAQRYLSDLVAFEGTQFTAPESVAATGAEEPAVGTWKPFVARFAIAPAVGWARRGSSSCLAAAIQRPALCSSARLQGAEEDRVGQPFVGKAGQLLTKIIEAMGLSRDEVYICNILKCRPPNNRDPQPDEIEQCEPYLKRQIEIVQPRVICTLGRFAAQTLLRSREPMGRLRDQSHHYEGIPLVATYHPAALLRNPQWKRPTWEDIKRVRKLYDGVEL